MMHINEHALLKGTILKHGNKEYVIEKYLGAGGFGITYLVSSIVKVSGCKMTIKYCIKEYFLSNDCWRDHYTSAVMWSKPAEERVEIGKKDFIAEAKRLKDKIYHSHIVRVKDVFEANETAYYVMEFFNGKTLRNYINSRGACNEEEAIVLMLPIIKAVGYLHDEHITHLDIKPDNIMIIESNKIVCPKLIDFGLSKHYDKKGKATSSVRVHGCSDGYSPIEQYQGIETFQPTADIYALAATFVFCIIGRDPKKSADFHPGELKRLLERKLSTSCLSAILNAMTPSLYERTQNIMSFMKELCPNLVSYNWNVETDNNITDPILLKKRKANSSFILKLRGLFTKKTERSKTLYTSDDLTEINTEKLSMDSLKLVSFCDEKEFCVSLYSRPEIVSRLVFSNGSNHSTTRDIDPLTQIVDYLNSSEVISFPADDETPIKFFWNSIGRSGAIILASDIEQFLSAAKLQYQLNNNYISSWFRIINPISIYSAWNILVQNRQINGDQTFCMDGNQCICSYTDGFCEIESLKKTSITCIQFDEEAILKGAFILKKVRDGEIRDFLLMDRMEYEIALSIENNGETSDFKIIVEANNYFIPLRRDVEISYDTIRGANLYLSVGCKRIDYNLLYLCGDLSGNGKISVSVEINVDKMIKISFKNKNQLNSIDLGEILNKELL